MIPHLAINYSMCHYSIMCIYHVLSWNTNFIMVNGFLCLNLYRFGPLIRSWCMRYEAKHHYFKKLSAVIGNFTNIHTLHFINATSAVDLLPATVNWEYESTFLDRGVDIGPGKCKNTVRQV